ncbi:MAG TPA: hypothetical protein VF997_07855 [Polyangia bacterium]
MRARVIVIVMVLALAGCGDEQSTSADLAVGSDMACGAQCSDACGPGTTCVGGAVFAATCLQPCQTTSDCAAASTCVMLDGASPAGNYCIAPGHPRYCGPCTSPAIIFCDGDVLVRPAPSVCGESRTLCPHGCGAADGGSGLSCS